MFTGLIEDVGRILRWRAGAAGGELTFETALPGREVSLGDSIAVNGCCLTVVKKAGRRLSVDVSPETLKRTNLADLREGDGINLERPLQVNDRLGGHMVTGHVDAVGEITRVEPSGDFTSFRFRAPAARPPAGAQGLRCRGRHQPDRERVHLALLFGGDHTLHAGAHEFAEPWCW